LFDHDSIVRDIGESDILERYAGHGTRSAGHGLDADSILRGRYGRGGNCDGVDGVVVAAANAADGEAVTA
jgi:hypothetical protein